MVLLGKKYRECEKDDSKSAPVEKVVGESLPLNPPLALYPHSYPGNVHVSNAGGEAKMEGTASELLRQGGVTLAR